MKTPYQFGQEAYAAGINAPAMDAEFRKTLSPEVGSNTKALKEWMRGWTTANLADTNLMEG